MYDPTLTYIENYQRNPGKFHIQGEPFNSISFLEKPQYKLWDIPLHLPIGIPAGPLLNAKYMRLALTAGFCLPIYKTVRLQAKASNSFPNILQFKKISTEMQKFTFTKLNPEDIKNTELTITNSFGVPSQDSKIWLADFMQCKEYAGLGQHLGLSFQGTYSSTWNEYLANWRETAIKAAFAIANSNSKILELNLSCPNENSTPLYHDIDRVSQIIDIVYPVVKDLDKEIKLVVKVGYLSEHNMWQLLKRNQYKISGIAGVNSIGLKLNSELCNAFNSRKTTGICGSKLINAGISFTTRANKLRHELGLSSADFVILGGGGVFNTEHFTRYMEAGSDVVQIATGAMWNTKLATEIAKFCGIPFQENNNGK